MTYPPPIKSRNVNIDITRLVARFFMIAVHFFTLSHFHELKLTGESTYLGLMLRIITITGVPIFLILTGYLMGRKTPNTVKLGDYYRRIPRILEPYILVSLILLTFTMVWDNVEFSATTWLVKLLGFKEIGYGWYVEMYLGLFLLIPFLNLIYQNLHTRTHKKVLIAVVAILGLLPNLNNTIVVNDLFLLVSDQPLFTTDKPVFFFSWWRGLYPLAFYFTGCYFREYLPQMRLSTGRLLALIGVIVAVFTGAYALVGHHKAVTGADFYFSRYNPGIALLAAVIFLLVITFKFPAFMQAPGPVNRFITKTAFLSYSTYLIAPLFDHVAYYYLNQLTDRFIVQLALLPVLAIGLFTVDFCAAWLVEKVLTGYRFLLGKAARALAALTADRRQL